MGVHSLRECGLAQLVTEFTDRLIIVRRSFLERERGVRKRFLQAVSEAIYKLSSYRGGRRHHSFRLFLSLFVELKGMQAVLEQMQMQTGGT